jgi:flagellum-specific peptidoglycan hydrolase FlgJ
MKKILLVALLLISVGASAQTKSQSYIEKFKDDAVRIMHQTGVPASIILAIAMHESASGCSMIAQNLNNQFGMKGYGTNVIKKDKKTIRTPYKKYDSIADSFDDFARVMTEKAKFSGLSDQYSHYDYLGWAYGIQKAGYASSHKWASDVLALVKKYQLHIFDEAPESEASSQAVSANVN